MLWAGARRGSAPLAVRHNASRILQKQEASATARLPAQRPPPLPPPPPASRRAGGGSRAPRQHQCGETESPPKAAPRSWLHLPWPQPHVMVAHRGCSDPPLGPTSTPRRLLWLSPIAFSQGRLVAHSTYPVDYMIYRSPLTLPACCHGPTWAINLSQPLQPGLEGHCWPRGAARGTPAGDG